MSCGNSDTIQYNSSEMANSIENGSKLQIGKGLEIKKNSIVAFNSPSSKGIRILRVIGLFGDRVEINNGNILVNGLPFKMPSTSKKIYTIFLRNSSDFQRLNNYEFSVYSANYSMFSLSTKEYEDISKMNFVDSIYLLPVDSNQADQGILNVNNIKVSNRYFFGPITIPKIGDVIDENLIKIIPEYLSSSELGNLINDDYYFCLGDNFPEAKDSRFIGLIPKKSVRGVIIPN